MAVRPPSIHPFDHPSVHPFAATFARVGVVGARLAAWPSEPRLRASSLFVSPPRFRSMIADPPPPPNLARRRPCASSSLCTCVCVCACVWARRSGGGRHGGGGAEPSRRGVTVCSERSDNNMGKEGRTVIDVHVRRGRASGPMHALNSQRRSHQRTIFRNRRTVRIFAHLSVTSSSPLFEAATSLRLTTAPISCSGQSLRSTAPRCHSPCRPASAIRKWRMRSSCTSAATSMPHTRCEPSLECRRDSTG